jgi:hypothetical protein
MQELATILKGMINSINERRNLVKQYVVLFD